MTNFDDQLYPPHSTVLPPTMYCQERERGSTSSISDMSKIHIPWPYPGDLSSGNSEQCCLWALCSVQGWVVPVGGPSPETQVNPSPSPRPQPTCAGRRGIPLPSKVGLKGASPSHSARARELIERNAVCLSIYYNHTP